MNMTCTKITYNKNNSIYIFFTHIVSFFCKKLGTKNTRQKKNVIPKLRVGLCYKIPWYKLTRLIREIWSKVWVMYNRAIYTWDLIPHGNTCSGLNSHKVSLMLKSVWMINKEMIVDSIWAWAWTMCIATAELSSRNKAELSLIIFYTEKSWVTIITFIF